MTINFKICTRCNESKPLREFYKRSQKATRQSWCKPCLKALARERGRDPAVRAARAEYHRRFYKVRREEILAAMRMRHAKLKGTPAYDAARYRWSHKTQLKKYGLTPEDYQRICDSQGGLCAICERPETKVKRGRVCRLSVDHHHGTGLVRGLLCDTCNNTLGTSRDSPTILRRAADYLERQRLPLGLVAEEN